jgi:hypothetical protein
MVEPLVSGYGTFFQKNRAAMILDVVLSRQRNYKAIVAPFVHAWMTAYPAMTLAELSAAKTEDLRREVLRLGIGARDGEPDTIVRVAKGLSRYCQENQLDQEAGVKAWAQVVEPLRYVWRLECYVGVTKGIGIALFAYLRMLAGADAIKPDTRVGTALHEAGLVFPEADSQACLLLAEGMVAELSTSVPWFAELEVPRLWFDQLLW